MGLWAAIEEMAARYNLTVNGYVWHKMAEATVKELVEAIPCAAVTARRPARDGTGVVSPEHRLQLPTGDGS